MQTGAALKVMGAQFADAKPAVEVGLAKFFTQAAQCEPTGLLFQFRQGG